MQTAATDGVAETVFRHRMVSFVGANADNDDDKDDVKEKESEEESVIHLSLDMFRADEFGQLGRDDQRRVYWGYVFLFVDDASVLFVFLFLSRVSLSLV